ncbi:MAG: sigma-70 family RNA polymerase sigma factor [Rhodocyclaceae bacterium]|nr:sigma-70 family RNA polymerase sigma factor [Rhodocyclaceae bacterium]
MTRTSSAKGHEPRAEEALIAAAQGGDRAAFEALVLPCQNAILRWLTRLTQDRPAAEELFQESLFKAYIALSGFRGESSFATWLSRIARNTFLAWRKALQQRPDTVPMSTGDEELDAALEPADGWSHHPPTPEEQLWQQELAGAIQKSLDALPESLREAFEQREQGGLSYAEIAQLQQVPVGTVRSRIHRAREAIAQDLKHLMEPA